MHCKTITAAALLGLSAIAAARPATDDGFQYTDASKDDNGQEGFEFPLANQFPNISAADKNGLAGIQAQALGTLPQP
ncbi:hypothetical protein LTR29_018349, partial [Friedmanniomyces endolithicus]